jgi:hypothetical protein
MGAPVRDFDLIRQLLAENRRRLDVQHMELAAREAALRSDIERIERNIAKEGN